MGRKTLLSWSSGKDGAWALHVLEQEPLADVVGLFCTVNKGFNRVAMHAVRVELLQQQAKSVGLPLHIIQIPYPCTNDEYDDAMNSYIDEAKKESVECFAFGDLFLEDVRRYREERLKGTGITPISPIWGMPTNKLSRKMVTSGLKAVITCIDPKRLRREFAGTEYNESFLDDIPVGVDPCGENGEFHSFTFNGPMFQTGLEISVGEIVDRDGFVFADLLLTSPSGNRTRAKNNADAQR
jgi:uncharacterized protein (TIGR00290 family)